MRARRRAAERDGGSQGRQPWGSRSERPRWPFCSAFKSRPEASPVLPTPVGPTSTMFSALVTKSSSAKARICFCETPGWRLKGNDSRVHCSGMPAFLIRQASAPSWRWCFSAWACSSSKIWAMRRRRRFLRSWSISSVIGVVLRGAGYEEEVAGDLAQDEALEPVEVAQAILQRDSDRLRERGAWVLLHEAQEATHVTGIAAHRLLLEQREVGVGLGEDAAKLGLVGEDPAGVGALPARRPMLGQRDPLVQRLDEALVDREAARAVIELDLVLGLAHLEGLADEPPRRRVQVGFQVDVAFEIHDPLVQLIDLGDPGRQRAQAGLLEREKLTPAGVELGAEGGVDLVAPGPGLGVEVGPVAKRPAGEEVLLDEVEVSLDAGRAVGVADLVGGEGEAAEALAEGHHLGDRHHVLAGAA